MFIQIEDPSDLPRPPEEVQIRAIHVDPYPDGQRLRVLIELTPFSEPPDLSLRVLNNEGVELADLSIVGAHQQSLGLTVHLRGPTGEEPYTVDASVHYEDHGLVHQFLKTFEIVREDGNDQA
jgi:hypothetical protein